MTLAKRLEEIIRGFGGAEKCFSLEWKIKHLISTIIMEALLPISGYKLRLDGEIEIKLNKTKVIPDLVIVNNDIEEY